MPILSEVIVFMKRMLSLLLCLCLALPAAALASPLTLTGDLTASYVPDGVDYRFTIALPQIDGDSETAQLINSTFAMEMAEQVEFKAQIQADFFAMSGSAGYTDVSYEITCNTDDYFSVLLTTEQQENDTVTRIVAGHVFARSGPKQGQVLSLPYLLGLLDGSEVDEWLESYQTERANACVRRMIWEQIEADTETPFFEALDEAWFEGCFYPEEDFWMAEDGALVFFLQPGFIADREAGLLTYRFTVEEILDEL